MNIISQAFPAPGNFQKPFSLIPYMGLSTLDNLF